jgi:cytochrome c oxidase subunit 2
MKAMAETDPNCPARRRSRARGISHVHRQRFTRDIRLRVIAVLSGVATLASGCSWSEVLGLGWPRGITPEAHANRELFIGSVIAALVVGGIVWALIFWTSAFHRRSADDTELPRQFGYNMPLELVLTVIPFLIISVLFYFTVVVQEEVLHKEPNPEVVIDVTAFQWNWRFGYQSVNFHDGSFSYAGADLVRKEAMKAVPEDGNVEQGSHVEINPQSKGEDRSYLNFDKVETLGTSSQIPVLVLPSGKRIEFQLASADVAHAFWVPEFLFKRDVYPHPEANHQDNKFQVSEISTTGAFVGRCAEFCGTFHAMMNFEVRVVSPSDFTAYLQQRMSGRSNAEALEAIHQSPLATTTRPFDTRRGLQAAQPPG